MPEAENTRNKVRGELLCKGKTLKDWAEEHGFKPDTVRKVLERHSGRKFKSASGGLTKAILLALSETTGVQLAGEGDVGNQN